MGDTTDRLAEIAKRVEDATEGPWVLEDPWGTNGGANLVSIPSGDNPIFNFVQASTEEDNRFIAHAREDVPFLLNRVRVLTEGRARLTRVLACEGGDETASPDGWRLRTWCDWRYGRYLTGRWMRVHKGLRYEWRWEGGTAGGDPLFVREGSCKTALEAMEAADKALPVAPR